MKTLIVYVTKNGTTEDCAQLLRQRLGAGETDLLNLRVQKLPDFEPYDCIVLGSYVHYGKIGKRLKHFAALHKEMLLSKKFGIFLCKGFPIDRVDPFEENFRPKLLAHAAALDCFGGVLDTKKLTGHEKYIADMVLRAAEEQQLERPRINEARIECFAERLLK